MDRTDQLRASPPMFTSPVLDRFTRVHPVVPLLIYVPVIVALNMTEQQIRSHLGVPDSVVKSYSEVIDSTTKLYYPNVTVLLSRHGVEDIACSAVTCPGSRH